MFANHPDIANKWKQEHPKNASSMMSGSGMAKLGAPKAPKAPGFSPWSKMGGK